MASYEYVGGPCAGRTTTTTHALADGAVVGCGGESYQFNSGNPGVLVWLDVGGTSTVTGPLAPKAHRGWHDMQLAVNRTLPRALSRAQRTRLAAARKLSRARR